jgi:quercetin dioxygenase-like cupin family protein
MTTDTILPTTSAIRWSDMIEYPKTGAQSKILMEDKNCRYTLMMLAAGMEAAAHATPRNVTIQVIEGEGILRLEGKEITLELRSGIFAFVPANVRHSTKAVTNFSFLLTHSEEIHDPQLLTSFEHDFPSTLPGK